MMVNNKILLAGPLETMQALKEMAAEGDFYLTLAGSLLRIGAGFLLGFTVAVVLAMSAGRFEWIEELLAPFMNLIKAIPVASFVVLLLIWWGSSFLAVAISFLVVLPNIYISTLQGLKNADVKLLEMAQVFRLSRRNRFFYIYRPALKPFLYSGLKISLGMCWKSGVAAEVIGTPAYSIGERLYLSKVYLNTAELFAWTAVMILLCMIFEKLVMRAAEGFFAREPVCSVAKTERYISRISKDGENAEDKRYSGKKLSGERVKEKETRGIRISSLTKKYDNQVVLDNISEEYQPGQIYYLTSPSGSGKTTLLRILVGLTKPDNGEVQVPGTCGMVFQENRLCEDYSAVKNVELVTGDAASARKALRWLLSDEVLEKPCRELSGGMKRRVALVRAMEADAEFILLDEPFTGMDAVTMKGAEAYIRHRQCGRTLLIATHIMGDEKEKRSV